MRTSTTDDTTVFAGERTDIIVKADAKVTDFPVDGELEIPSVQEQNNYYVPTTRDKRPRLANGDGVVTVRNDEIQNVGVIVSVLEEGVVVYSIRGEEMRLHDHTEFGSWFDGGANETRVYQNLSPRIDNRQVETHSDLLEDNELEHTRDR